MGSIGPTELLILPVVFAVILFIPMIFYFLTLSRCLALVSPENRIMEPGKVWLNLIPLFGLGWHIYTVMKIRESLKKEFSDRVLQVEGDFGYVLVLVTSVLFVDLSFLSLTS